MLSLLAGCATTDYVPANRTDYAVPIVTATGSYISILDPTIKAISLDPPFDCTATTVQIARRGLPNPPEEPTELTRFPNLTGILSGGVYSVQTIRATPEEKGPKLFVMSGDESSDPAVTLINVVNRYNDVAACLRSFTR